VSRVEVMRRISEVGLMPVVRAQSADEAIQAINAIREGGVDILEITMTVPGAIGLIQAVAERYGSDLVLGAGTVLDAETARACILAGAQFIVSPSLNLDTIAACRRYSVPVIPGALTPTEVVTAWTAGADVVKVFPCGAVGGASYIKALKAPLPQIELIPTGGVSLKTVSELIAAGAFALGVGADLVDLAALRKGDAASITEKARQYVSAVAAARSAT
jgi:2-dehydro-3-deoxyphosphogluconate aldolase / (4S)-4-hydroxy-2-oxoglutarate aldolase